MQLKSGYLLQGGKYKIIKPLGQGGFGITYLAEQTLMERKVCIKEFFMKEYCDRNEATSQVSLGTTNNKAMMEKYQEKFLKEARLIARLDHPNIIRIHDVFTENNTAYYVMDYIEGKNLNDIVKERGALPESEALGYIIPICEGLEYVHSHNINHLDIKPGNILVRKSDNRPILIDFGMSKQYDEAGDQTSSTPIGISAGYAPLEMYQVGGVSSFSPQTDIYELGATLYRLVTGKVPPTASDVMNEGLPEMPAGISAATKTAIEKAMEFRKKNRPESISSFLSLLKTVNETIPENDATVFLNTVLTDSEETFIVPENVKKAELENANDSVAEKQGRDHRQEYEQVKAERESIAAEKMKKEAEDQHQEEMRLEREKAEAERKLIAEKKAREEADYLRNEALRKERERAESEKKSKMRGWIFAGIGAAILLLIVFVFSNQNNGDNEYWYTDSVSGNTSQSVQPNNPTKTISGSINGHDYVDLGLSVKWATCNVGASSPYDYGSYFAWGETSPKSDFTWESYKWGYASGRLKKYGSADNKTSLEISDDVAHINWGGAWRMPTFAEWEELYYGCTWSWTVQDGKNGYRVTGMDGNSIFLPAAGMYYDLDLNRAGVAGYYWSSTRTESQPYIAYSIDFESSGINPNPGSMRYSGLSVRPVIE